MQPKEQTNSLENKTCQQMKHINENEIDAWIFTILTIYLKHNIHQRLLLVEIISMTRMIFEENI